MIECESVARRWGNSIGLIIPKEVADRIRLKENKMVKFLIIEEESPAKKTFGFLKAWNTPTSKIIAEMREDAWDE